MEKNTPSPAETLNQEANPQANNNVEVEDTTKNEPEVDYKELYEKAQAKIQRVEEERKAPTETNLNNTQDLYKRLEAIEEAKRQENFAHEHGLSAKQSRWLFSNIANPSEKSLEDTAVKAALDAIEREERLSSNTPGSRTRAAFKAEKGNFTQSSKNERRKWFQEVAKKHSK